ncbi:MAG: hypothetical protein ACOH5I_08320 [Oligoflexus sp.]
MCNQTWSKDLIERFENEISQELMTFLETQDTAGAIGYCLKQIFSTDQQEVSELKVICYIVSTLNLISINPQNIAEYSQVAKKLEKLAKSLLEKNNIRAGKSRLSFVHGQLKQAMASVHKTEGNSWAALWESSMGLYLSRGSTNPFLPFQHLCFVTQAIDSGIPSRVMDLLNGLESKLPESFDRSGLRCLRVKALRLAGMHKELRAEMRSFENVKELQPKFVSAIQWEKAYSKAVLDGDHQPMHQLLFRSKNVELPASAYLKYALWMRAQGKKELCQMTPKVASIKRTIKKNEQIHAVDKRCLKVLQGIEDCYDTTLPIELRLRKVGGLMNYIENLDAEYKLLALAAVVRWLNPRQKQMAAIFYAEYTSLSCKMSDGECRDVLNLFQIDGDLTSIQPFYSRMHKRSEATELEEAKPRSAVSQALFSSVWDEMKGVTVAV